MWPFVSILIIVLIIYLLSTEIQSQDCEGRYCYNTTPLAEKNDSLEEVIEKMITTARVDHNPVEWRKALLLGLIGSFVILSVFAVPLYGRNFLLLALIIFIVAYFVLTWTNWNYWRNIDVSIETSLQRLRSGQI